MKLVQNFVRSTLVFVPEASFPSGEKLLPIECWGTQGPGHGVPKPPCLPHVHVGAQACLFVNLAGQPMGDVIWDPMASV